MHNQFEEDMWKTFQANLKRICEKLFKFSRPQGQIIDVKCEKSQ